MKRLRSVSKGVGLASVLAVVVLTVVLSACAWVLAERQAAADRSTAFQAEITKNTNLALSHAERASRSIEVLDQILLAVRTEYLLHGNALDLSNLLEGLKIDRNFISVVALIDEGGQARATTLSTLQNYADREYFLHHQASTADDVLVGRPLLGRVTNQWVVPISRRIYKPDGSFGGVVLMTLSPAFFATEYEKTTQGPHGAMALIGLDGITRARRNANKVSFGDDAKASQLFKELPKSPAGHYVGVAASDGVRRLVAYRTLDNYPLVTIVASSFEDVLATTAGSERLYRGAALGVTVAMVLSGVTGIIYLARRRRMLDAVENSERRYRLLFESSLDAVIGVSSAGRLETANPAACALFLLEPERLHEVHRSELLDSTDPRLGSLLALESDKGILQGAVRMVRQDGSCFEAEVSAAAHQGTDQIASLIVRDVSDRKRAQDQISTLAYFDPLTNLPNRRLLLDRLHLALASNARHQRKGALLFVDLDSFKTLNDTLGHFQGDVLLKQVATRLVSCIREGDTCARLGGDEFVAMLEDLSADEAEAAKQAQGVGEKLLKVLGQAYPLAGAEYASTASIGITLFGSEELSMDEPLKRADMAMYQAKAAGRNTLRFFDPAIQTALNARAELEAGLRQALQGHQFTLHYQPQVVGNATVSGAEALVRWQHPHKGLVSPAEFIPLAEDTGLIVPLGLWVLETACEQLARWAREPHLASLNMSVNVSERQFRQADFTENVLAIVARTGANPRMLRLEITEGLLITQVDEVISKMLELKRHGVGFELDDFGTGYSSLAYLKRLPLDRLKIDQGFVRDILEDPNDAAIAKMVIVLAQSLGLAVIAEGVETMAQRDFLATQGCDDYQGYLFSRPLPIDAFERWVHARLLQGAH